MNDIRRIGGWSAILYGVAFLVAYGLFIPTYAAVPPEALETGNFVARLAAFEDLTPARRSALALGFALENVAVMLMFPAFLAVYAVTKPRSEGRAALALGMATVGIPLFILVFSSGFSLLQLSDGFGTAGDVARAARAAAYGAAEGFSLHSERLSFLFLAWATVLWFGLMRELLFARWVRWAGLGAGLLGAITTVGSALVPALGPISAGAGLLLIAWFVGLGMSLLRSERGAR